MKRADRLLDGRRIFLDVGAGALSMALLAIVAVAATIVLARSLSVEQFGKISLLLLLFNLTFVLDAVRPITIFFAHRHPEAPDAVFATIFWLDATIGVALAVLVAALAITDPFETFRRAELFSLAGAFALFFVQSAYWGWADAHGLVAWTSMVRALSMIAVYICFVALASYGADDVWYAAALVGSSAVSLVIFREICRTQDLLRRPRKPDRAMLVAIGREVGRYLQFNLATLVLATVDRLALLTQAGPRALGLYSGYFELATKPMAFMSVAQRAVSPHITKAAAAGNDVYPAWGFVTKVSFLLVSLAAWGACLAREFLVVALLGQAYVAHADAFAAVLIAQCFVVLGFACALLLNAFGDFRVQKTYYVLAAIAIGALAFPAARIADVMGVAVIYLLVRTVDAWLTLATVARTGRRLLPGRLTLVTLLWLLTTLAAWFQAVLLCASIAAGFAIALLRWQLTHPLQSSKALSTR